MQNKHTHEDGTPFTKEEFLQKLKTDKEFNDEFGNKGIDQISELIKQLKDNPDSRRLLVSAWAVHDLPKMTLPPCHYGFQLYTRELSLMERKDYAIDILGYESLLDYGHSKNEDNTIIELMNEWNVPTRTISLMWNQRSIDGPLGLPFNIASYALLLEILGKVVNMVPDEIIGNLGDCHIYTNQIEGVKEHIGRDLNLSERIDFWFNNNKPNRDVVDDFDELSIEEKNNYLNKVNVPKKTREPFELPKLQHQKTDEFYKSLSEDLSLLTHLEPNDFMLKNYKSHSKINFPLSN